MIASTIIGLDIAKQIFQVHGVSADGNVTIKRKLRRSEVLGFFGRQARCIVGLEACGGSHFWAREIRALGHDVRLIPPAYVSPTSSVARQTQSTPRPYAKPCLGQSCASFRSSRPSAKQL